MKYLIFDAGPIISLTMNGMLPVIERLKEVFDGEFVLTPDVKREVVDRPMKIKKFKLEALQVKDMLERGVFKMSSTVISNEKLDKETQRVMKLVNGFLRVRSTGEKISVVHDGECACLAFSNLCGAENVIVIDERSTRLAIESPNNLHKLMQKKLHAHLERNDGVLEKIGKPKFIRSPELLYIAFKKDLLGMKKSKELLDALLYGVKFKGCAISSVEIEEMKRMAS